MAHIEKYKAHSCGHMLAHYRRDPSSLERDNIDPNLTNLNRTLTFEQNPNPNPNWETIEAKIDAVNDNARAEGKRVTRKDAVVMADLVLTLPEDVRAGDEMRFFEAAFDYFGEAFGRSNVLGGFIHRDEMRTRKDSDRAEVVQTGERVRDHIHIPFTPIVGGRFCYRDMVPRSFYKTMHKELADHVEAALGYRPSIVLDREDKISKVLSRVEHDDLLEIRDAIVKPAQERADELGRAADAAAGELEKTNAQLDKTNAELRLAGDELGRKQAAADELERVTQQRKAELDSVMGATRQQAQALADMRHEAETESRRADAARRRAADAQAEVDASVRRRGEALAAEREAAERLESVRRDVEEVEGIALAGVFELGKLAAGGDDGARERAADGENQQLRSRLAALEGERGGLGERERAARSRACELDEGVRRAGSRRDCIAERLRGLRERADRLWAQLLDAADHFVGSIFTDVGRLKWVFDGLGIESHEGSGYDAMPDPGIAPPRRSEPQQQRSHHRRR